MRKGIHSALTATALALFAGTVSAQQPGMQQPGSPQPGSQQPGSQQPGSQQPGSQPPGTMQPGTPAPGTQHPGGMPHGGTMGQQGSMEQQGSMPLAGVVTHIDKKTKMITVVTPVDPSMEVTKLGDTLIIDRERNLVAIRAALEPNATVMRDGKSSRLTELKEGDIVRTSFDSQNFSFSEVNAVSPREVDRNLKEMRKELPQDSKGM